MKLPSTKKYRELKNKKSTISSNGIEYAFGNEQFGDYLKRHNLNKEEFEQKLKLKELLITDYGAIGTPQAFETYYNKLNEINEEIKRECSGDEIFTDEFSNFECGYTGDYSEATMIAKSYFPNYKPKDSLVNKLFEAYEEANW